MIRRLAVGVAIGASAVCGSAAAAVAAAQVQDPVPIGPNQAFVGLVNGSSSKAVIEMACFGPSRPGERGHPLAGQTLEVQPVGPVANPVAWGGTGDARQITATYAISNTLEVVLAKFSSYYVKAPLSTRLWFPCSGDLCDPIHTGCRRAARAPVAGDRDVRDAAVDRYDGHRSCLHVARGTAGALPASAVPGQTGRPTVPAPVVHECRRFCSYDRRVKKAQRGRHLPFGR